jgi:hypothetical protein
MKNGMRGLARGFVSAPQLIHRISDAAGVLPAPKRMGDDWNTSEGYLVE